MTGLLLTLLVVALAFYVNDSWRSLERVRQVARDLCAASDLQFLDGSVLRTGIRLERGQRGWQLVRQYQFEFSIDGVSRYVGRLSSRGLRVQVVSLQLPDGGHIFATDPRSWREVICMRPMTHDPE